MFNFVVHRKPSERATSLSAKLTAQDQAEIALLHALSLWSNTAIAEAYGIDRSRVPRIRNKHLILRRTP